MKEFESKIVWHVVQFERDFNTVLPNNSFFKSIALDICRKHGLVFAEVKSSW